MFEFDDITNLINMSTTQPVAPSDVFTIDWASEVNTVPGFMDPTTPNQQNFMFPGLNVVDSSWTAEPPPPGLSYETSYYPNSAPLPLPVTEPYPLSVLPPGLMFTSAATPTASIPSTPSTASTFASPASGLDLMFAGATPTTSAPSTPSTTSTFASPALSHMSSHSHPYDPSAQPRTTSIYDYMSPYTSPSHVALLHNPPRRPAQYHPVPSSLGPNRTARTRPLVLSQPYPQTPSALANARLRSSVCPLADPGYDWSALRSPTTLVSNSATSSGSTIAGWAEQAITAPVAHGPSEHVAPVETPLHELQTVMSSSNDESSTASSPAPSLSFLHAEASPAARSPSPSPWNSDMDSTTVSSTVFSTTPTGPMFPGLTSATSSIVPATLAVAPMPMSLPLASMISSPPAPVPSFMPIPQSTNTQTGLPITGPPPTPTLVPNPTLTPACSLPRMPTSMQNIMPISIPTAMPASMPINTSAPEPTPAPATPVQTPFPESLLAFAASEPVSSMPESALSLDSAYCAPAVRVPMDEMGVPTMDSAPATTHSSAPAPTPAHPQTQIPTSGRPRTPAHLSVHSLARPPTSNMVRPPAHARVDTPAPIDDSLDTSDTTASIFASTAGPTASSTPVRMPLAPSQHTRQASSNLAVPAFTWPNVPTTHAIAQAAADDALNGDPDDDIDQEIAFAAGLQLSNTGFQSAERLTEGVSDGSESSGRLSARDNSKRGGKTVAILGTKWMGGPGGELAKHGLPQGIDGQVHRWTFSETPLSSQTLDATGRAEGDVHFSPLPQSRRSDPPFITWVVVKIRGTDLQWFQWQGGHPHPVNTGYVLKPAQLPRTKPQWIKKETWLKTVAKGKEVAADSGEGLPG
ncbi:hypothetical protein FRC12_006517 [Ceratobasidium sp. 428]|nr:hypothetical protein FRC12_006517 [Ceratobasidium sp. 428]